MLTSRRIGRALLSASMALALPHFASAEDADTQEVRSYTLTDSALAKYTDATRRLAALPAGDASSCDDETAEVQTLTQMAARLDAVPATKAAIRAAGMTSREYVLFSMALLYNGMAAPDASKANIDFMKKHDAELKGLEALKPRDECDE